jgi:small subunit ribosomal protein S4
MIRKPNVPGVHGKKMSRGGSEYGKQLAMKQKIKRIYGVLEKQFRKHFADAQKQKGVLGDNLMARLELRLDNVVYRAGFASSRSLGRQLVNHGSFRVNGKKADIPSFETKVGDVITVGEFKKGKTYFKNLAETLKTRKEQVSWIMFDTAKMEAKIIATPDRASVGVSVDPQMVVEFYSR